MKKRSNLIFLIIAIILIIPSLVALFVPGFFLTDDANWMVVRFSAFYEALRSGQFPVRFLARLNHGYGHPVADFLYPLFMYLGVPIHILGFSFVGTIKIIFGMSLISSVILSFLWLRKLFDNLSSLVGSVLYTLFPYHLWDLYKRGSVGEVLALAIVPFILWQIERGSFVFTSLGIAFLILSHNTLALLFLPIIFIYMLIRKIPIKFNLLSVLFGLGVSFFFWFPALYDKQYTVFDKIPVSDYSQYFIALKDLDILGLVSLFAILASMNFIYLKKEKMFIYFLIVSLISMFFVFPFSSILWKYSPFVNLIQFPFRLVSLVVLSLSFLAAYQVDKLKGRIKWLFVIVYVLIIYFSAIPFISPKTFQNYPDTFYSTNQDSTTVKNEYMPIWVKSPIFSSPEKKVEIISGKGVIKNLFTNANKITFNVGLEKESLISVNTVYFPGWELEINKKQTPISYLNNGLIEFDLLPGEYFVSLSFKETNVRLIADLVSVFSLFIIVFLVIKPKKFIKI